MYSWFDQHLADRIDKFVWHYAKRTGNERELKQLAKLFDARALRLLHHAMAKSFSAFPANAVLTMKLAWIDKIPLADSSQLSNRTELGDAVLFAIEEIRGRHGRSQINARAVLLQAKVTKAYRQLTSPAVPVSPMVGSTARELTLLSRWPTFDLFKTSRSGMPLAKGLDLSAGTIGPFPFGWYLAAPRIKRTSPSIKAVWTSWWMAGAAVSGQACNVSVGSFLRAFLQGSSLTTASGKLEAGAAFNCPSYPPPTAHAVNWDRLCAEIIAIVESTPAPPSLFASGTHRIRSMDDLPLPFLLPGFALMGIIKWSARLKLIYKGLFIRASHWASGGKGNAKPRRRPRRRTPVLIIHSLIQEDEG